MTAHTPAMFVAPLRTPAIKRLEDSQWRQVEIQKSLYHWLNERGVIHQRARLVLFRRHQQNRPGLSRSRISRCRGPTKKILNRQNIFDGTWGKTPSMGWGFVPLTQYEGGGAEATIEPLAEHLDDYQQLMMQYYSAGIQACYRGPRLFDTEKTKETVIKVISWYKKYREILNSDIVHLRRADGRDWDGILHANPYLKTKGLMMLYNPTKEKIIRTVKIPLYYTGLTNIAQVREKGGGLIKIIS